MDPFCAGFGLGAIFFDRWCLVFSRLVFWPLWGRHFSLSIVSLSISLQWLIPIFLKVCFCAFLLNITNFKRRLRMRGYRDKVIDKLLSEVKHRERMSALQNKTKTHKKILRTIRDRISPLSTESKINHHAQMVSYRKPTVA